MQSSEIRLPKTPLGVLLEEGHLVIINRGSRRKMTVSSYNSRNYLLFREPIQIPQGEIKFDGKYKTIFRIVIRVRKNRGLLKFIPTLGLNYILFVKHDYKSEDRAYLELFGIDRVLFFLAQYGFQSVHRMR